MTVTRSIIDSLLTFHWNLLLFPIIWDLHTCSMSENRCVSIAHNTNHELSKPEQCDMSQVTAQICNCETMSASTVGSLIPATISFISKVRSLRIYWAKISTTPSLFQKTSMTEEDYKQAEESFLGLLHETDKPVRLVSIKTKLQAQQCYDLLLTEMVASGDSRGIHWDNQYCQKRTASYGSISKTSNWFFPL